MHCVHALTCLIGKRCRTCLSCTSQSIHRAAPPPFKSFSCLVSLKQASIEEIVKIEADSDLHQS